MSPAYQYKVKFLSGNLSEKELTDQLNEMTAPSQDPMRSDIEFGPWEIFSVTERVGYFIKVFMRRTAENTGLELAAR